MFGEDGRIGGLGPANNAVLEPELGTYLPPGVALYATRILASGDLTPEAVIAMEGEVGRAVGELAATGVDVIVYADMVTTFIMEDGWNEARTSAISSASFLTKSLQPLPLRRTTRRDHLASISLPR